MAQAPRPRPKRGLSIAIAAEDFDLLHAMAKASSQASAMHASEIAARLVHEGLEVLRHESQLWREPREDEAEKVD